jgi:long-chain acyl-CoA synthetase
MESSEKVWQDRYNHPAPWDQSFPPMSMVDMVVNSATAKPDAVMIDFLGRKTSYGDMLNIIRRVAKGLQDMGVQKGDRVGLYLPNVPHYVAAYYGAMMAGATVVNFSPLYTAAELEHQVEDSGTKILFTLSAKALLPTALEASPKRCRQPSRSFSASSSAAKPRRCRMTRASATMPTCYAMAMTPRRSRSTLSMTSRCCNIPAAPPAVPRARCSRIRT